MALLTDLFGSLILERSTHSIRIFFLFSFGPYSLNLLRFLLYDSLLLSSLFLLWGGVDGMLWIIDLICLRRINVSLLHWNIFPLLRHHFISHSFFCLKLLRLYRSVENCGKGMDRSGMGLLWHFKKEVHFCVKSNMGSMAKCRMRLGRYSLTQNWFFFNLKIFKCLDNLWSTKIGIYLINFKKQLVFHKPSLWFKPLPRREELRSLQERDGVKVKPFFFIFHSKRWTGAFHGKI